MNWTLVGMWMSVGVGVYLDSAVRNWDTFENVIKNKEWKGLAIGALGVPFWPIALAVIYGKRNLKTHDV